MQIAYVCLALLCMWLLILFPFLSFSLRLVDRHRRFHLVCVVPIQIQNLLNLGLGQPKRPLPHPPWPTTSEIRRAAAAPPTVEADHYIWAAGALLM